MGTPAAGSHPFWTEWIGRHCRFQVIWSPAQCAHRVVQARKLQMIAVIFEVTPRPGEDDRYLEIAASLRPDLDASGGLVYLERFRSQSRPRTLLSHQIWSDEASLTRWRTQSRHHQAQRAGRDRVFEDYRLRVAAVVAARNEAATPDPIVISTPYNDPDLQPERHMLVVRSKGGPIHLPAGEIWASVYADDSFASVADVAGLAAGIELLAGVAARPCVSAAHLCLVSRDYGMFDRHEAPQYFPKS